MNILFVSVDLLGADLAYRLKGEGHNVRFFVENVNQKMNYDGMLEKIGDWKKEINWVGKDGLIIFDNCGYGKEQDDLRKKGFSVIGGSEYGDKLEHDRQYGQKTLSACEIPIVSSMNFDSIDKAIKFVKKNKGPWVIKQNGHADKMFNYVGSLYDGYDVVDVLNNYRLREDDDCVSIDLQKRIDGVEIGVARYFNGNDWVGPIEMNIEHKDLFAGDMGPKTDEMGTVMWFDDNEKNKLFQVTLAKLKDFLIFYNFRGDVDINCIVNKDEVYPLELTTRFGWPATHLHAEMIKSPLGEFFKSVADSESYKVKYKKGYGVVVVVATPPFPYQIRDKKYSSKGEKIYFKSSITDDEMKHIHFEEVSKNDKGEYIITGETGIVLSVTGIGKTISKARENVVKIIDKIIIPKKFYRNDIGVRFENESMQKLRKWGWV